MSILETVIKNCLGCNGKLDEPFLDLGRTPLANAFVPAECKNNQDEIFRLAVAYCPSCHLVQLTDLVPPGKMFNRYLYFSSYSDSFLAHAQEMATTLIERFQLDEKSRVLEIASNDGYLLQYFQKDNIPVLGVEPATNIAEEAERKGIPTLNQFFGTESVHDILNRFGQSDLIIGNNVLAHVPTINNFFEATNAALKPTGISVFEFPYLKELLDKTEFDTIYHEHVFYYSLLAIEKLAERAGLQLFDVTCQSIHGGSLRIFLCHKSKQKTQTKVQEMISNEISSGLDTPKAYTTFSDKVKTLKENLRKMLVSKKNSGRSLAAYGAPAKGNTLLNYCDIGTDILDFTVDRNPHKQ
ncbi:MAG: methyltransferase domain-containing protein, partial [bacterium]